MCAALVKARRAGVGPDLRAVIDHWSDYIAHRQFRIADGTLARQRPQPESLWADDLYMSVPALAQMGALTGDRAWFDDAVKQVLQFHGHLWDPQAGLYAHGRHMNQPLNPEFYWARANGWAMLASVELLDVLPADHPGREQVLEALRAHIRSVAKLQSGTSGLWHQMLDKTDSYLETSASAIFVYSIARAINRGWISPVSYGSVAQAGWIGVTTRVNAKGQVEGTCVGTTLASDHVYYYNRPQSVYATHGYGPVLLAGAEMIRLLQNPAIDVQYKLRTYHYVPKHRPEGTRVALSADRQPASDGGRPACGRRPSRCSTCSQRACSRCSRHLAPGPLRAAGADRLVDPAVGLGGLAEAEARHVDPPGLPDDLGEGPDDRRHDRVAGAGGHRAVEAEVVAEEGLGVLERREHAGELVRHAAICSPVARSAARRRRRPRASAAPRTSGRG